jgi:hypothetical protein
LPSLALRVRPPTLIPKTPAAYVRLSQRERNRGLRGDRILVGKRDSFSRWEKVRMRILVRSGSL